MRKVFTCSARSKARIYRRVEKKKQYKILLAQFVSFIFSSIFFGSIISPYMATIFFLLLLVVVAVTAVTVLTAKQFFSNHPKFTVLTFVFIRECIRMYGMVWYVWKGRANIAGNG